MFLHDRSPHGNSLANILQYGNTNETKTPKTLQYSKTSLYSHHLKGQIRFSIEDDNDAEKFLQTKT